MGRGLLDTACMVTDLVPAIADRVAAPRKIGAVKRAAGLPVVNAERAAVVFCSC